MAKTFYKIPDRRLNNHRELVASTCSMKSVFLWSWSTQNYILARLYQINILLQKTDIFVDWIVLELLLCYHVKSRMLFFETLRNYLQWIPKPAHISIFYWRSITVHFPFIHHFYCIFISISKHRRITDDCMSIIKLFNTAHFAYYDRLPKWLHISPHRSF